MSHIQNLKEEENNPFGFILSTILYIMFGRGICEKYQSRDEKFPEPNGE
jgi:hypothetical protein